MKLDTQKRIAADILKCSPSRVFFDTELLEEISEAITKEDIRGLIKDGAIMKRQAVGISRSRANKRLEQRRKGRQKGQGSRKGRNTARLPGKERWMAKIRAQRKYLRELRETGVISRSDARVLYRKAKGGQFRSKRHINMYLDENDMRKEDGKK